MRQALAALPSYTVDPASRPQGRTMDDRNERAEAPDEARNAFEIDSHQFLRRALAALQQPGLLDRGELDDRFLHPTLSIRRTSDGGLPSTRLLTPAGVLREDGGRLWRSGCGNIRPCSLR